MIRPELTPDISVIDFDSFYWLKEELAGFCRAYGLSAVGSKMELSARVRAFLETGLIPHKSNPQPTGKRTKRADMPLAFTRQSVIEEGWRCSQALRAFFEQEIGPSFHFDGLMRDFIHHGAGKTLHEAICTWEEEQKNSTEKKEIAAQFEYNRHMRAYFQAHPGVSMAEAIRAWNERKKSRFSEVKSS